MTVFIFRDDDGCICSVSQTFRVGLEDALFNLYGVDFSREGDEYIIYDTFSPKNILYKGQLTPTNLSRNLEGLLRCDSWAVLD
jgi:hypothetical protein